VKEYYIINRSINQEKFYLQIQMAGLPDLLGKDKDKQSPASKINTRPNFRDAYRWGPFIMIGNWR
jgi:hypothetical protein